MSASQALHPSIIPKLDPEYVQFHQKYVQDQPASDTIPWDLAKMREVQEYDIGCRKPLDVGKIDEFEISSQEEHADSRTIPVRAYTPPGEPSAAGWPILLYFHGGGWVVGGLDTEKTLLTYLCVGAKCIVMTIDYRLAPENKFPAAIDDGVEVLRWVLTKGKAQLKIDTSKIATGGNSAGGNIAAGFALKSAQPSFDPPLPKPMLLQILLTTPLDQTATDAPGGRWEQNKYAPILGPAAMLRVRDMYLRNEDDRFNWEASPLAAPDDVLKYAPKTFMGFGEMEIFCDENNAYAERLNKCGVEVECVPYKGGTHVIFLLDSRFLIASLSVVIDQLIDIGIMKASEDAVSDVVNALAKAFETV